MKTKLILAFVATTILLASCSKETAVEPELKDEILYPVTFNVSTFKSEVVPMANAANKSTKLSYQGNGLGGPNFQSADLGDDWLGNKIEHLEYYVFNESGSQVNRISQERLKGDGTDQSMLNERFGKIEDTLPAGRYKVVFRTDYGGVYGDYASAFTRIEVDRDAFGKAFDITVSNKGIEQSVELDRIVGKLEVKILDDVPNGISRIVLSITGVSIYHYFYGGLQGTNNDFEKTIYTSSSDFENLMFLYFGYQGYDATSGHATVNIRAYGTEGNLVVDKIVNDVPVGVNKTTILSGKLFEDAGSSKGQAFSVSLKDTWLEKGHISF